MSGLTKKADVLAVLRSGGYVTIPAGSDGPQLAYLSNAAGEDVPAWQTAIKSCLGQCTCRVEVVTFAGRCIEWRIWP